MRPHSLVRCTASFMLGLLALLLPAVGQPPAPAQPDAAASASAVEIQGAIDRMRQHARDVDKTLADAFEKFCASAPELEKPDVYLPSWGGLKAEYNKRLVADFSIIERTPIGMTYFRKPFAPFELLLGDNPVLGREDAEVIALYREYLCTGNANALRTELEKRAAKLTPAQRRDAIAAHRIWTPAAGQEFFEALIARSGGWYGYHVLHLQTHLAFAQRHASIYRGDGEPLEVGLERWKGANEELLKLVKQLVEAQAAWAEASLKLVKAEFATQQAQQALPIERVRDGSPTPEGIDKRQAESKKLDEKLAETCKELRKDVDKCAQAAAVAQKKVSIAAGQRLRGIEFRPKASEPGTIGVFSADEPPAEAARDSTYAGVFGVLRTEAQAPRTSRMLMLLGPKLPATAAAVTSISGDTPRITYTVVQGRIDRDRDPQHQKAWEQGWEAATANMTREEKARLQKMNALLVRANLDHAMGGVHEITFETTGGRRARGTWVLDVGDLEAAIQFIRPSEPPAANDAPRPIDHWDPTETLYLPEVTRVELQFAHPPAVDAFDILLGRRATGSSDGVEFIAVKKQPFIKATRVTGSDRLYRTEPLLLAAQGDHAGQTDPGVTPLTLKPGDRLLAMMADAALVSCRPGVAQATLLRAPSTPWLEALRNAGGEDRVANWQSIWKQLNGVRPLTDDEIGEIASNFLGGYSPTNTKIRLGHAAAMIMLRDEFIAMMQAYKTELDRIDTDAKLFALMRELRPHFANPQFRFGDLTVKAPGSIANARIPARRMMDLDWVVENAHMDDRWRHSKTAVEWQHQAVKAAWAEYRTAVDTALTRAKGTTNDDLKGLVQLTASGFEPVIARVTPRLMKLKDDANSVRWVPDTVARKWLASIPALGEEAVKKKEADTALIATVGMAFSIPTVVTGGIYGLSMSIALNLATAGEIALDKLPQWFADRDELVFATGAMELLGHERLNIARLKDRPIWITCAELGIAGIGLGADVWRAAAEVQAAIAMARVRQLLQADEKLLTKFRALSPEDQAAAVRAMEHAQARRAANADLQADELATERLAMRLDEEAKARIRDERTSVELDFALDVPFMPKSVPKAPKTGEAALRPFGIMPEANKPFAIIGGNGKQVTFELGDLIGRGGFAHVYELRRDGKATDEVIKFFQGRGISCSAESVVEATESGSKLLADSKIPQLEIRVCDPKARPAVTPKTWHEDFDPVMPYVIQKKLDPSKHQVLDWKPVTETRRHLGHDYEEVVGAIVIGAEFTEAHQRAVVRLFRKMADEKLVWEDSHLANMYFFQGAKGLEAGILDQDRIIKFGQEVKQQYMEDWLGLLDLKRENFEIKSLLGSPQGIRSAMDAEAYWAKLFEYRMRWISYNRDASQFQPVLLNPDIVRQEFGNINKWVDLDFPILPQTPGT